MKNLKTILASEGLLTKSASGYRDSDGQPVSQKIVDAILTLDPKVLGSALDQEHGDDAYVVLDGLGRVMGDVLKAGGLKFKGSYWDKTNRVVHGLMNDREKAEIARSPWKKELRTLEDALAATVAPRDVPYIRYQPRKRKGVYYDAIVEDMDSRLGNIRSSVDEEWAKQNGTTLKRVFEALDGMGATLVSRGMGPGKKKPWIDYDGWAY